MGVQDIFTLLLNLIYCILCSFFVIETVKTFYNVRINLPMRLIYITLSVIFSLPFPYLQNEFAILRLIGPIIIFITLNIVIIKISFLASLLSTITFFILLIAADSLGMLLKNFLFSSNPAVRDSDLLYAVSLPIDFGIQYLALLIFRFIKFKINDSKLNVNKLSLSITYLTIALIYSICNLYFYSKYTNLIEPSILIINTIVIVIYFILTLYTIYNSQRLFSYTEENSQLKSYINAINSLHDELRRFRHNYSNILMGLKGFVDDNDTDGLKKYLDELLQKSQNIKNIDTFDFSKITNPALKSLFLSKISTALNKNIKVMFEITEDLHSLGMNASDLCEVLGVFIDNAIEECEKLDISSRRIEILFNKHNDILDIIIANTYKDKPDINKMNKRGFSTKQGDNRGIGLYSVKNILESYNNVIRNTLVESNRFIQEIQIKTR